MAGRLTDEWFEARFYGEVSGDSLRLNHEDGSPIEFAEAQGLWLWCPCGFGLRDKDGKELYPLDLSLNLGRPHGLMIPFANPPSGVQLPPDHGPVSRDGLTHPRWNVGGGSGLHDLTLTPSIAVGKDPECWHGYITNGEVR